MHRQALRSFVLVLSCCSLGGFTNIIPRPEDLTGLGQDASGDWWSSGVSATGSHGPVSLSSWVADSNYHIAGRTTGFPVGTIPLHDDPVLDNAVDKYSDWNDVIAWLNDDEAPTSSSTISAGSDAFQEPASHKPRQGLGNFLSARPPLLNLRPARFPYTRAHPERPNGDQDPFEFVEDPPFLPRRTRDSETKRNVAQGNLMRQASIGPEPPGLARQLDSRASSGGSEPAASNVELSFHKPNYGLASQVNEGTARDKASIEPLRMTREDSKRKGTEMIPSLVVKRRDASDGPQAITQSVSSSDYIAVRGDRLSIITGNSGQAFTDLENSPQLISSEIASSQFTKIGPFRRKRVETPEERDARMRKELSAQKEILEQNVELVGQRLLAAWESAEVDQRVSSEEFIRPVSQKAQVYLNPLYVQYNTREKRAELVRRWFQNCSWLQRLTWIVPFNHSMQRDSYRMTKGVLEIRSRWALEQIRLPNLEADLNKLLGYLGASSSIALNRARWNVRTCLVDRMRQAYSISLYQIQMIHQLFAHFLKTPTPLEQNLNEVWESYKALGELVFQNFNAPSSALDEIMKKFKEKRGIKAFVTKDTMSLLLDGKHPKKINQTSNILKQLTEDWCSDNLDFSNFPIETIVLVIKDYTFLKWLEKSESTRRRVGSKVT